MAGCGGLIICIAGMDVCDHPGIVDEIMRRIVANIARGKGAPMRWGIGVCLGVLLCTASLGYPDDWRRSPFPADEHWEGYRTWRPERGDRRWRGQQLPDQFTIDKPGKCEVICQRVGREYKCREYRC